MEIPVIDFTKCGIQRSVGEITPKDFRETGENLYKAFADYGYAYISNTGFPGNLIDDVNEVADHFFSLPLDSKMKYRKKGNPEIVYDHIGAFALNRERPFDYHEGLRVACHKEISIWPEVENIKETISEFQKVGRSVLLRIVRALGMGMKLKDVDRFYDFNNPKGNDKNESHVKIARYPPITEDVVLEKNQIRIGEHSDFGTITLLFQDDVGGLQVQGSDGKFFEVPRVPGTILVIIPDMLSIWSGGRLKPTVHRVVIPVDQEKKLKPRSTVLYFAMPNDDVKIDELERENGDHTFCKNKQAMTAADYLLKRFADVAY